jgi:hypothetical protein
MAITFDGDNLEIIVTTTGTYDAKEDIYSDWKVWFKTSDNAKYPLAFDTTGGDPLDATTDLSAFYFLRNDLGWRIKMPEANGRVIINGDLFPRDDTIDLFTPSTGSFNVFLTQVVSSKSLVSDGAGGGGLTAQQTRDAMLLTPTGSEQTDSVDTKIQQAIDAAIIF